MTDDIDTHGIRPAAFWFVASLLCSGVAVSLAMALHGVLSR